MEVAQVTHWVIVHYTLNRHSMKCDRERHTAKQMKITKSVCKSMIRIKSGLQLIPHCSVTCYRTQSEALFGKTVIAIMPCLTEVERGQAISQLMQGHTQRQVAVQFSVNVRSIQRLVIRLRVT